MKTEAEVRQALADLVAVYPTLSVPYAKFNNHMQHALKWVLSESELAEAGFKSLREIRQKQERLA